MAVLPSSAEVQKTWTDSAVAAGARFVSGCQKVTENPAAKAIANVDKWQTNVASARSRARYVGALGKVTLEGWKSQVSAKGGAAFTNGVRAAGPKYGAAMSGVLAHMGPVLDRVRAMPKTSLADSIARVTEYMTGMAAYGGAE